jgi:hypothetical protein
MSLVELLELAAALAIVVGIAWAAAVLVPAVWAWPAALGMAGVLLLVLSMVIDRKGGAG